MRRTILMAALLFLMGMPSQAFKQKEVSVRSDKMNKDVPVTVITPDSYKKGKEFPVIYLLHGYSGDHTSWAQEGVVGRLADQYNVILVMPDGGKSSW